MRRILALLASCAASASVHASQISLATSERQSLTPSVGFEIYGLGSTKVGFDTAFDIVWNGMVRFDLGVLPPGTRINSAELRMTPTSTMFAQFTPFYVHRITTAWVAGPSTDWNNPWITTPGGDRAPASDSTITPLGGQTIFDGAALAADVQGWVDVPSSNHGWLVIEPNYFGEAQYGAIELVLDYDPPCAAPVTYCAVVPNSTGQSALISSSGSTRISDANFALVVTGCRPNVTGFFIFSDVQTQIPWGDGFLCIGGQLRRLLPAVNADASGTFVRPIDFTTGSASVITPGSTWNFQLKYRDIAAGGAGFNSSNGLQATFCN